MIRLCDNMIFYLEDSMCHNKPNQDMEWHETHHTAYVERASLVGYCFGFSGFRFSLTR